LGGLLLVVTFDAGTVAWSCGSTAASTCGVVVPLVELFETYRPLLGLLVLCVPLGPFFLLYLKKFSAVVAKETGVPFCLLVVAIIT